MKDSVPILVGLLTALLLAPISAQAKTVSGSDSHRTSAKASPVKSAADKQEAGNHSLAAANICERAGVAVELTHKMPRAILVSVSMAETGRLDQKTREVRPWPWTINAEGRGYYFATKKEAIAATKQLLKTGVRSIDVGCMQVNLRYHPQAFETLEDAFDPITNISYGATFLKELHGRTGSWPTAVAQYHSESTIRNKPYFARVIRIWLDQRVRVASLTEAIEEKAALIRGGISETPIRTIVIGTGRPAPMVIDSNAGVPVREQTVETVGLRFSIDEYQSDKRAAEAEAPEPQVLEPAAKPTVLADATPPA